ncbi:MAG: ECF transporter S component [Bacilli bacterium]|jgi:uncharacterized membrane protein|nr:ECF transporter S component [Bacilli bacterium]
MKFTIKEISYIGLMTCLVLIGTYINIMLPFASQGGLVHLGTPIAIISIIVFGKKIGTISGALGMSIFDIMGGWLLWAPATFIARLGLGYLFAKVAYLKDANNYLINVLGLILGGAWMVLVYYIFESIVFNNWVLALGSIPGNCMQLVLSAIIGIPIGMLLKRHLKFNQEY